MRDSRSGARSVLCLISGSALPLSLAPFNFWPVALLGIAVFAHILQHHEKQHGLFNGFCFGLGMFGVGSSWVYVSIHEYGHAPWPLAALLTLLFVSGLALVFALPFWAYSKCFQTGDLPNRKRALLWVFPALWVLGEWLRSWLLTGFPWLYVGYAHVSTPLSGWLPIGGVYLASGITVFTATVLLNSYLSKTYRALWIVPALFVSGLLLSKIQWTTFAAEPIRVAIVQPNFSLHDKWNPEKKPLIRDTLANMSASLWHTHDLVLWPEAALSEFYQEAEDFLATMDTQAEQQHSTLVTGIPYFNQQKSRQLQKPVYHNSILALGEGEGLYHKVRLVPFGEYVPLENTLRGLIQFFDLPMSQFSKGDDVQTTLSMNGLSIASFICYEIVYPDLVAHNARDSAFLITISNDSWFGDSIGPQQHLQMAQARAVETGRYLVRGTNDGISAVVSPQGQLLIASERFVQQTLSGTVHAALGVTPFMRYGSWPVIGMAFLIVVVHFTGTRRRKLRQTNSPA